MVSHSILLFYSTSPSVFSKDHPLPLLPLLLTLPSLFLVSQTSKAVLERVQSLVNARHSIRNISVIAHVDHGKSTLTDSLVSRVGLINESKVGELRVLDTRKDEQQKGITIKSTGISLPFEIDEEDVKMASQTQQVEVQQSSSTLPGNPHLFFLSFFLSSRL